MTTETPSERTDEDAILLFQELKSDLTNFSNVQIVTMVRTVLSKLRSCLPAQHLHDVMRQTPPLFQFMFIGRPTHNEERESLHLDELVQELVDEDKREGRGLFKSEIETLRLVILVLNRISFFFKHWGVNPYPYALTHELQQALQERPI